MTNATGHKTTYAYYSDGDLETVTPPSPQGATTYAYDADNRITTVTSPTGTLTLTYDGDDRITKLAYTGGPTISYTYDPDGNVTKRVDPTGTTTFTYDTRNELTKESLPGDADACSEKTGITLGYDPAGNLTSYCDGDGTTTYHFNAANEVTSLAEPGGSCTTSPTTYCSTFTYDPTGERTKTTFPGGATETITYNAEGQEAKVVGKSSSGAVLTSYAYTYTSTTKDTGLVGSMAEDDPVQDATTTYAYSALGQLTSSSAAGGSTFDYSYDADGDRCSTTTSCADPTYTYNADTELTSSPPGSYAYNASGEETSSPQLSTLTYDTADQTTSIKAGSTKVTLAYAEAGQFLLVKDGSTTLVNGPLGLDEAKTSTTTTYFIRDPTGNVIGEKVGSTYYYFLENDIGSVTAVISGTGTVEDRFSYDPYGNLTKSTGSLYDPIRFAGGYYEATSGLTKFGTRYYDPKTGRWTQENPVGGSIRDPSTLNGYDYAVDDPVSRHDPTGLSATYGMACLTGAAFGAAISIYGADETLGPLGLAADVVGGCVTGLELTLIDTLITTTIASEIGLAKTTATLVSEILGDL